MKNKSIFVVLSLILVSCNTNIISSTPTISSNINNFYIEKELNILELNEKINSKNSFALLIFSPECSYCNLAKETIYNFFLTSEIELCTLNTYNTKNISRQQFYLESIYIYLNQDMYNENKSLFEEEIKLYTPIMIGFKNGQPTFTIIGYNKGDYIERLNAIISNIKATR